MNAEQKAFYEYGEARSILKERKSLMRFTEGYGECSDYHGEPRIMYGVEDAIRDAWQKRAACRAWKLLAQRHCLNCLYRENPANAAPCADCTLGDLTEDSWLVCNWKPRKEASND